MGKNDPYIEVPAIVAADEVGYIGFNTDPTPNEKYTVKGVTTDPEGTPETNKARQAEVAAHQAGGIEGLEHSTETAGVDTQHFVPDRGSRASNLADDPSITVPGDGDDAGAVAVAEDEKAEAYSDYTRAELIAEVKERDLDVSLNAANSTFQAALVADDAKE